MDVQPKLNKKGKRAVIIVGTLALFVFLVGGFYAVKFGMNALHSQGLLLPEAKPPVTAEATQGTDLPRGELREAPALPSPSAATPVSVGGKARVRMGQITWAATMPSHAVNGGVVTQPGSILARYGIEMEIVRQDMYPVMHAEMKAFAKDFKAGKPVGEPGMNAVQIMGDGSPGFSKAVNDAMEAFGGEGVIIYATGFSYGEDKFIGPLRWQVNPKSMEGGVVVGVFGDGDLHLAQSYAHKHGVRVNPNKKCWDPKGLNFVGVDSFDIGDKKFVNGEMATFECTVSDDGKSIRPGKVEKPIEGTGTWAPGDKWVHDNYKGKEPIVALRSTRDDIWQMPAAIIVHKGWAYQNFDKVVGLILGLSEAADLMRSSPAYMQKTCALTAAIYRVEDQDYWCNTFRGFKSTKPLVQYDLGGSRVINLADNMLYFGAQPGFENSFERVYNYFARLDMATFPEMFEDSKGKVSVLPVTKVVDTTFMKAAWKKLEAQNIALTAALPDYTKSRSTNVALANVSYPDILFDTGMATLRPGSEVALDRMVTDLASEGGKIALVGHTDDVGPLALNMKLSRDRATTVQAYLQKKSPMSFPPARFVRVDGKGPTEPPLGSQGLPDEERRAKMRRVQVLVLRTDTQFRN